MGSRKAKQNELTYAEFIVFSTDYVTPLTGQAGGCTYYLARNNINAPETVTITEISTDGHYYATFTPLSLGTYSLKIFCPDGRVLEETFVVEVNDLDDIVTEVNANEVKIDSVQSDTTDILTDTNEIQGKLPTNDIADQTLIDTDLTNIESKIDTVDTNVDSILSNTLRILGLAHENVWETHTWTGDNHVSSIVELYDSKTNAQAHDGATGLIGKYTLTVTYTGSKADNHLMVRDS